MPRGRLNTAEERTCEVCGSKFVPSRVKQRACSPSTGRKCAQILSNREHGRRAAPEFEDRACEKCGQTYTPKRADQKTCGADCPGVPRRDIQCVECGKVVKATWRGETNQIYCSAVCRDRAGRRRWETRFRRYNMTRAEYDAKNAEQEGRCMVCGSVPRPHKKHPGLVSDHCHETGKNRDLLCANCNTGLGYFGDDPAVLRVAAAYVERWRRIHADMKG